MPSVISFLPLPSQKITAVLDGYNYALTIKTISAENTIATLSRDGVVIVEGARIVANRPILRHTYQVAQGGNFLIITQNEELPDYPQFGTTQQLVYVSAAELATV